MLNVEQIAQVAHETNAAYCRSIGDNSQKSWEEAAEWQRESAIQGVRYALDNPDAHPADQHNSWLAQKVADGWTYGPVKDATVKTHPCIISYSQLPLEQRMKDYLFRGVVETFAKAAALGEYA